MPITGYKKSKSIKTTVTKRETVTKKGKRWFIPFEKTVITSQDTITLHEAHDDEFNYDVSQSRLWAAVRGKSLLPPPKGFLREVMAYRKGDYEGSGKGSYVVKAAKIWHSKRVQNLINSGKNFVAAVKKKAKQVRKDNAGLYKKYGC